MNCRFWRGEDKTAKEGEADMLLMRQCSLMPASADAAEVALEVLNHPVDKYIEYTLDETLRQLEQF